MAMWIPTNKMTGVSYPAISDKEKEEYLADPFLAPKFKFQLVQGSDKPKVSEPIEAKKVDSK